LYEYNILYSILTMLRNRYSTYQINKKFSCLNALLNNFLIFSVIGLNFDYVYLNIVGHSVYGAFNVGLFWVKTIQVRRTIRAWA
jgi:hypothetical protein